MDTAAAPVATQAAGASPVSSTTADLRASSNTQIQDMAEIASIQMEYAMKQNLIQAIEKMVTNTASFIKNSTQDATK
jgi:hypothetical protein